MSLLSDDMFVYIVNPKLLEISESIKIIGYKDNMQKPVEFVYNCNEQLKSEINKIPFIVG